jgi:hypothetical protein
MHKGGANPKDSHRLYFPTSILDSLFWTFRNDFQYLAKFFFCLWN